MFKMFCIYPFVAFVLVWLASDVEIGASVYSFDDNFITIEFPKESFRSEENPDPWYSFYWNAESAKDGLKAINDAVVE
ncbi:hypothetical protein [Psychromonas ossibalaenae]|uniref:hypothetical protein n=1 Tax=Psychromonas ossibalaenae TaxID=444922 RepID=UPI000377C047|nr:hypothetical protein [Psychromonas ossibalaenae]